MIFRIDNISFTDVKTTIREFGSRVSLLVPRKPRRQARWLYDDTGDEFNYSDSKPRSSEERTCTAVMKSNEANIVRLAAEINRSAEIDSVYEKLLPEYTAYINPELNDLVSASSDVVSASYKKKPVEIKCKALDDGIRQQEISFNDGSQISYVSFSNGGKMRINEEEFEMPVGTVVETKSVNGRVFSQLIQIPGMQRRVVNKPEYLDKAEQIITSGAVDFEENQNQIDDFLELTKSLNLFSPKNQAKV